MSSCLYHRATDLTPSLRDGSAPAPPVFGPDSGFDAMDCEPIPCECFIGPGFGELVTVIVTDPQRAAVFYAELLGTSFQDGRAVLEGGTVVQLVQGKLSFLQMFEVVTPNPSAMIRKYSTGIIDGPDGAKIFVVDWSGRRVSFSGRA